MKVKIESSKIIKPSYDGCPPPSTTQYIPLSPFDRVNYDGQMAVIYAYRPPTPPNLAIRLGLQKVLSEYREWAGRLGKNHDGEPVIFLNDNGVCFVEASVDDRLDDSMPSKPSPVLLALHPSLKVEELVQVQLTRFTCGSLVVGFTAHHLVADGHSTSNFLVAWGKACRGLDMGPLPTHDRAIFVPRDPPIFEFEHKGVEYTSQKPIKTDDNDLDEITLAEEVVIHKVHFTTEFLAKLKAGASMSLDEGVRSPPDFKSNHTTPSPAQPRRMYSTFECLVAHLWRSVTRARALRDYETTQVRISVNGRMRLKPRVPNNYFGNLVLWAFPTAKVKDLLSLPISYATKVIHEAVSKVDDNYFRSFIDYSSHKLKGDEDLYPTENINPSSSDLEVDSWLRFPFYDLDFGCGGPYMFMPSYFPIEGIMLLSPSFKGDGSIDAFIPLSKDHLERFKQSCYSL